MKGLTDIKRDNNLAVIRAAGDALEGWWTPLAAVIEMKGDRDESTGMGTGPGSQAPE